MRAFELTVLGNVAGMVALLVGLATGPVDDEEAAFTPAPGPIGAAEGAVR